MKELTKEKAKILSIFFAIVSSVCAVLMLVTFGVFINILHQFYFVLFFSIFGTITALILAAAIVYWVFYLKLKKAEQEL